MAAIHPTRTSMQHGLSVPHAPLVLPPVAPVNRCRLTGSALAASSTNRAVARLPSSHVPPWSHNALHSALTQALQVDSQIPFKFAAEWTHSVACRAVQNVMPLAE